MIGVVWIGWNPWDCAASAGSDHERNKVMVYLGSIANGFCYCRGVEEPTGRVEGFLFIGN